LSSWKDKGIFINPIDYNGDGKQDLIVGPDDDGDWSVLRSNGSSLKRINNYIYHAFPGLWHLGISAPRVNLWDQIIPIFSTSMATV